MEEQLLNEVGRFLLQEVKETFSNLYPSRSFGGIEKPLNAQFPPVFSSKIATGQYVNSLQYRINTDADANTPYIEIYSTLPENDNYGRFIDSGRSPGKFPNIREIEVWVRAKGIQPKKLIQLNRKGETIYRTPTLKQLVYLISRGIARDGIFPFPFREITLNRVSQEITKKLEPALAQKVEQLIREQVVFIVNPQRQTR